MLVSDEQAKSRLSNPLNLVNRLTSGVASPAPSANRSSTAMSLFGLSPSARNNPSTPPDKIKDIEAKKTKFTFNIKLPENVNPIPETESESTESKQEETTPQATQALTPLAEKLRAVTAPINKPETPAEKPETKDISLDDLIEDATVQVNLVTAHNSALELLNASLVRMNNSIDEVKPERLPQISLAATKVIESIRKEKIEISKRDKEKNVHYHFYTPEQKKITDYEILDVESHVIHDESVA